MITDSVQQTAAHLMAGQVAAVPTETVYGLAANGLDPTAVGQIFLIKNRPATNPLILHCRNKQHARAFARSWPKAAEALADAFWPGPLTLVLPKADTVIPEVNAGLDSVALRVSAHPMMQQLLKEVDFPIAAPSANLYGQVSPTTAEHVDHALGDRVELILNGGPCQEGLESTIVQVLENGCRILRHGTIPAEAIEAVVGPAQTFIHAENTPLAPGMVPYHYAPKKPLYFLNDISAIPKTTQTFLVIAPTTQLNQLKQSHHKLLSFESDIEAAQSLYGVLHAADLDPAIQGIIFIQHEENGRYRAIHDRVRRAAAKHHKDKSSSDES